MHVDRDDRRIARVELEELEHAADQVVAVEYLYASHLVGSMETGTPAHWLIGVPAVFGTGSLCRSALTLRARR
jgi:hypothetical protein